MLGWGLGLGYKRAPRGCVLRQNREQALTLQIQPTAHAGSEQHDWIKQQLVSVNRCALFIRADLTDLI